MWPIPILIVGKKRPGHFALLILSVFVICNLILPVEKNILDAQVKIYRKSLEQKNITVIQDVSTRRSHSTKIRSRRQKNILHNHWFSDLKSFYDESMDVSYPWIREGDECQNLSVHFAKEFTFHPTALVSYPGSGSSFLRYLIECTTGIFTGSLYSDLKLFEGGFRGEMNYPTDGRTIIQKTYHDTPDFSSKKTIQAFIKISEIIFGYRGIILVRNPYNAIWTNFKTKKLRVTNETQKWKQFVIQESKKWSDLIKSWIENSQYILLVQYENLLSKPRRELIRILNYFGVPVDNRRLDCTIKHFYDSVYQSSKNEIIDLDNNKTELRYIFSQDLIDIIQRHVSNTNQILKNYSIPSLSYNLISI